MRRVVAVVMIIAVLIGMCGSAGAVSRMDNAKVMESESKKVLLQLQDIYERNGKLSEPNAELGYAYFKMYMAARRVIDIERMYPDAAAHLAIMMDADVNVEDAMDLEWKQLIGGEIDLDKFVKDFMIFLKYFVKAE